METTATLPEAVEEEAADPAEAGTVLTPMPVRPAEEALFEIGLWLSGLEGFLCNWDRIARNTKNWGCERRLDKGAPADVLGATNLC